MVQHIAQWAPETINIIMTSGENEYENLNKIQRSWVREKELSNHKKMFAKSVFPVSWPHPGGASCPGSVARLRGSLRRKKWNFSNLEIWLFTAREKYIWFNSFPSKNGQTYIACKQTSFLNNEKVKHWLPFSWYYRALSYLIWICLDTTSWNLRFRKILEKLMYLGSCWPQPCLTSATSPSASPRPSCI